MKAAVFAFVTVLGLGSVAQAAPAGPRHVRKANALAAAGKCKQAIPEFNAAFAILRDPALLFNRAECLRKLRLNEQAVYDYRRFLDEMPDAPNRKVVEGRIASLDPNARLPVTRTIVEAPPPPASEKLAVPEPHPALRLAALREPAALEPVPPVTTRQERLREVAPSPEPPVRTTMGLTQTMPAEPPATDRSPWIWMSAAVAVVAASALGAWYVTARPRTP